ncbi:MAG: hypothetical protein ACRDLR_03970 [Gaiellaceae bacterium]
MPEMTIAHYPPADERGAERLRTATTAWSGLIGELHAVGLRPYLELEHGEHDDPLRLYCDLDDDLLLDVTINDEGIPDTPARSINGDWIVFIQGQDGYLAEVYIERSVTFPTLASRLADLVTAVAHGEHPLLETW